MASGYEDSLEALKKKMTETEARSVVTEADIALLEVKHYLFTANYEK